MALVSITIPDAQVTRVVNAICDAYGYVAGQGVSKAEFARQALVQHVKNIVVGQEQATADAAALAAVVPPTVSIT